MLDDEGATLDHDARKVKHNDSKHTEDEEQIEERKGLAMVLRRVWAEHQGTPPLCFATNLDDETHT